MLERVGRPGLDAVLPPVFVLLWSSAFVAAVIGVGAAPPLLLTFARLTPVVTSVLTWWVLGTGLSTLELVGLALGGVGVLFAATRTRPPRARSAPRGRRRRSEVPV